MKISSAYKTALSITSPEQSYSQNLDSQGLSYFKCDRSDEDCAKLFGVISSDRHKLASLLPPQRRGITRHATSRLTQFLLFIAQRIKVLRKSKNGAPFTRLSLRSGKNHVKDVCESRMESHALGALGLNPVIIKIEITIFAWGVGRGAAHVSHWGG